MKNLQQQAKSGFIWSLANGIGSKGISFLIMILLARILVPADFGLIAMINIFIQLSQALVTSGFSQALVQKEEVDTLDYSSVFFLNIGVAFFLYFLLFASSGYIAEFYNEPRLVRLIQILSCLFVINSAGLVQESILIRELKFKQLAILNLPSVGISGVVALILACFGFGVWSIVAFQIVNRVLFISSLWTFSSWRPISYFSFYKIKSMWGFSSYLLLSGLVVTIYNNVYQAFFGKLFTSADVGHYQNSYTVTQMPVYTITGAFGNVLLSSLSRVKNDIKAVSEVYNSVLHWLSLIVFPTYAYLYLFAEQLVLFVFTEKWLPSVPYLKALCILACIVPLLRVNLLLFNINGDTKIYFFVVLLNTILSAFSIIVFYSFGIEKLIWIQIIISIIIYVLVGTIIQFRYRYNMLVQLKQILPVIIIVLLVSYLTRIFTSIPIANGELQLLLISFFSFSFVYLLFLRFLLPNSFKVIKRKVLTK